MIRREGGDLNLIVGQGDRGPALLVNQNALGERDQLIPRGSAARPGAEPIEQPLDRPRSAPQRAFRRIPLRYDADRRSVATAPFTTSLRADNHSVTGFSLHTGSLRLTKGSEMKWGQR
jgi:hypothetical protein